MSTIKEFAAFSLQYFTGLTLAFHTEAETRKFFDDAVQSAKDTRKQIIESGGVHIGGEQLKSLSPNDA